jgi:hypothetical protein
VYGPIETVSIKGEMKMGVRWSFEAFHPCFNFGYYYWRAASRSTILQLRVRCRGQEYMGTEVKGGGLLGEAARAAHNNGQPRRSA